MPETDPSAPLPSLPNSSGGGSGQVPERRRVLGISLRSSPESIKSNSVTWLAIAETLVGIALVVLVALRLGTVKYILIWALAAPFLLLRSPDSMRRTSELFRPIREHLERVNTLAAGLASFHHLPNKPNPHIADLIGGLIEIAVALFTCVISLVWFYAVLWVTSGAVRLLAVLRYLFVGLKRMPSNWTRTVWCTDFATPAELVPGETTPEHWLIRSMLREEGDLPLPRSERVAQGACFFVTLAGLSLGLEALWSLAYGDAFLEVRVPRTGFEVLKLLVQFCFAWAAIAVFMDGLTRGTAYLYRLSLKSTCLLWFPFAYASYDAFNEELTMLGKLRMLRETSLSRAMRGISWCILAGLSLKFVFLHLLINHEGVTTLRSETLPRLVSVLHEWGFSDVQPLLEWAMWALAPGEIHLWHIVSFLNAVVYLTLFTFYYDSAEIYQKEGQGELGTLDEARLKSVYSWHMLFRWVATIYTVTVLVGTLLLLAVDHPNWLTLDFIDFSFELLPAAWFKGC
ncbi:hypothetical protein OAX78_01215 [Planctomycetota bacterium]|nr:hypothetical protein [Planctomycetota bacterium]